MSKPKVFLKIVVIGDSGVGKTSLLQQYIDGEVSSMTKPTIGADFLKKVLHIDGREVTLQIWDTAGQERFQSLGLGFYRGADCCALVCDITSQKSFENVSKWRHGFIDNATPSDLNTYPMVLMGNKLDKEEDRQVTKDDAERWCKENNDVPYFETSAHASTNVEDAFMCMVKRALQ